jgi:NAD-dependent DNA ligase
MSRSARSKTAAKIQDRLIDELIGICRGVIADGEVDEKEAIYIGQWIENHRELAEKWPVNILYARVMEMLQDGVLNQEERVELLETLRNITGDSTMFQEANHSTTLPLDLPAPKINFEGKSFCLTGRFVFGSTFDCEETIAEMGGTISDTPSDETDYLIIGEFCSPEWRHTTFGRSIEKAVELKEAGNSILIISEEHWVESLSEG